MLQIQQGDVLLQEIGNLPKGAKRAKLSIKRGKLVLVEGEQTGHAHTIAADKCDVWNLNGVMYLRVTSPTPIVHDTHKPLEIPTGIYQVGQVREHDYLKDIERRVID